MSMTAWVAFRNTGNRMARTIMTQKLGLDLTYLAGSGSIGK